ncbi:MAG: DUF4149 domain-containing protein [Candidatus Velthaea sp.]|jgi:hypothetical protein
MKHDNRERGDRILAAVEIPALGIWTGAQLSFAFLFAPLAFKAVGDPNRFNAVVSPMFAALGPFGYTCGGIAFATALARAAGPAHRTADLARAGAIALAVGGLAYHQATILPAMAAIPDVTSAPYHALHERSRFIYAGVLLLGLGALIAAAARPRT